MKVVTMRGKNLDMAALIAKNPNTVAVGNAQMNARGDIITARGKVVKAREQIAMDYHASNPRSVRTVGIRALTGEMFLTPEAAVAAAQAQTPPQAAQARPAQAINDAMSPADAWTAHKASAPQEASHQSGAGIARKRKLVDPDEAPDGNL